MVDSATILFAAGFIILVVLLYGKVNSKPIPAPFPPGPRGLPFLGNAVDLPKTQPWVTYSNWGKIYGGIVRVKAFGDNIVVLNDAKYAIDMLEKKSRIYSDRPKLMLAGKLIGWDAVPGLISFGSTWTEYRRLHNQFMGTRPKVDLFESMLQGESDEFLKSILESPDAVFEHIRRYTSSIVLMLTYGYKAQNKADTMVNLLNETMDQVAETSGATNTFLVDIFPILRHIPESFPGAGWKKKVHLYKDTLQTILNTPFHWIIRQIAAGNAQPCFVFNVLDKGETTEEEELILKWAALGVYSGGYSSTVAGISLFFLAMTLQASAQQKAQAEIDDLIGTDRLPTLADRENLPYCDALFTEVLRKYIIGPLAFPHAVSEDDIHDGYFIPKGSVVIANVWQFCRDPATYSNPETFSPERFLASDGNTPERDPRKFVYGFGRRICPGNIFADTSMWLACISAIAAFNIQPPIKNGTRAFPSGKVRDGWITHPEHFECEITPRSKTITSLVSASY